MSLADVNRKRAMSKDDAIRTAMSLADVNRKRATSKDDAVGKTAMSLDDAEGQQ